MNSPFILRLRLQLPGGVLSGMPIRMPQIQRPVMPASKDLIGFRSPWFPCVQLQRSWGQSQV